MSRFWPEVFGEVSDGGLAGRCATLPELSAVALRTSRIQGERPNHAESTTRKTDDILFGYLVETSWVPDQITDTLQI